MPQAVTSAAFWRAGSTPQESGSNRGPSILHCQRVALTGTHPSPPLLNSAVRRLEPSAPLPGVLELPTPDRSGGFRPGWSANSTDRQYCSRTIGQETAALNRGGCRADTLSTPGSTAVGTLAPAWNAAETTNCGLKPFYSAEERGGLNSVPPGVGAVANRAPGSFSASYR